MQVAFRTDAALDHAGHQDAHHIGRHLREVVQGLRPIAFHQAQAQKNQVAGLRVREHAAADQVCIDVQKAAGEGEHTAENQALRHRYSGALSLWRHTFSLPGVYRLQQNGQEL